MVPWRSLGAILGRFWEAKMRPKTLQDGARKGQEGAKTLPRQLRIASKTPSKRVQMPLRPQKIQKRLKFPKIVKQSRNYNA